MTELSIDFEKLKDVPRLLIEAELQPVQGDRFQPTGFPDLGAAVYERPDGKRMILVESAQSIANRLEATILDESEIGIAKEFEGLPYIVTTICDDKGNPIGRTSSLIEPHRINSPYIIGGLTQPDTNSKGKERQFKELFVEKAEYQKGGQLPWKSIAAAYLFYDPNSLIHGSFINVIDGRLRVPRAISGFIEAEDVNEVASGGVKSDVVDSTGELQLKNQTKEEKKKYVYGNIPYHRMEYTAKRITAYFNLDISLLEGYGLPDESIKLLITLGLYKVRRLLNQDLRLRTACDFIVKDKVKVKKQNGSAFDDFVFPEEGELIKILQEKIRTCNSLGLFTDPSVTELKAEVKKTAKNSKDETESDE